jgi:hypothetical protein
MKKIIVLLIMFIFLINSVLSFSEDAGDIPSTDDFTGGSIGEGSDIPIASLTPVTSDLNIKLMITCEDSTRDTAEWVFYKRGEFHDDSGTPSPDGEYQKFYNSVFISDWTNDPKIDMLALSTTETNPANINPSGVRYEGKCYAWVKMDHQRFDNTNPKERHGFDNKAYGTWYQVPTNQFYYEVDWDSNKAYCKVLGGDWLEKTGDIGDEYDGMQCCGDDWIWIHNYPLDYKLRTIPEVDVLKTTYDLCLYWDEGLGYGIQPLYPNSKIDDDATYGFADNSYMCSTPSNIGGSNGDHFAYDTVLGYDDVPEELTYNDGTKSFYFLDGSVTETDLGFYSPSLAVEDGPAYNSNARFCNLNMENWVEGVSGTSKFEWLTINEAATKSQLICELYLGFNWTGSKCCGAPGNPDPTYNDIQEECNARNVASGLLDLQSPLSRLTYQKEFEEDCDLNKNRAGIEYSNNRACYNNVAIDNQTITSYSLDNPEIRNIYNEGGELFICDSVDYQVSGFTPEPKCTLKGAKDKFALCTYSNDSWINNNEAVLIHGWSGATSFQEIEDEITESSIPQEIINLALIDNDKNTECCMSDSCWDGRECVPTKTDYYTDNIFWDIFNQNINYDETMSIFKCNNGTWSDPLYPQYDWDYNTENPKFCIEDYQCSCTTCGSNVDTDGCTTIPHYYENDNLCIERNWTTKTKVLATTLMDLGGDDYVLHCDDNSNSINNYATLEFNFENDLNSVCVLSENGKTNTLGFSFKSLAFDTTDEQTNAKVVDFIQTALDEEYFNSCSDAIISSTDLGTYVSCDSTNKFWFNNKLKILLYNQDGILAVSMANFDAYNTVLQTNFNKISTYIENSGSDITGIGDVNAFKKAFDFNKLYLYNDGGAIKIFGINEILHDSSRSVDPKNRNFLGVWYDKSIIDNCNTINLAYQSVEPSAYCDKDANNDIIVLNKNLVSNIFPYWLDLTAKLRFE